MKKNRNGNVYHSEFFLFNDIYLCVLCIVYTFKCLVFVSSEKSSRMSLSWDGLVSSPFLFPLLLQINHIQSWWILLPCPFVYTCKHNDNHNHTVFFTPHFTFCFFTTLFSLSLCTVGIFNLQIIYTIHRFKWSRINVESRQYSRLCARKFDASELHRILNAPNTKLQFSSAQLNLCHLISAQLLTWFILHLGIWKDSPLAINSFFFSFSPLNSTLYSLQSKILHGWWVHCLGQLSFSLSLSLLCVCSSSLEPREKIIQISNIFPLQNAAQSQLLYVACTMYSVQCTL